jgi:predicted DsbA family dithiol-disulfide isomerase
MSDTFENEATVETTSSGQPIRIDIVSDVVCPWCIIGFKQLERALSMTKTDAEIHWHPFELNPQMPDEGENLREHLADKYGTTLEGSIEARARLTDLGKELGFTFSYYDEMRTNNTFRAHQLLHWAGEKGRQNELQLALFESYFSRHENINDPEALGEALERAGLSKEEGTAVLSEERFAEPVRQHEQLVKQQNIQGVPAMVFQQRYIVSGAQGVTNYVNLLQRLSDEGAAQPSTPD